jgi:TolA-binding protein
MKPQFIRAISLSLVLALAAAVVRADSPATQPAAPVKTGEFDSTPAAEAVVIRPIAPVAPATSPSAQPPPAAPSEAEHLLSMAHLCMNNNMIDLAKQKLQEIIDHYPNDPAAAKAKDLLGQMSGQ